MVNDYRALYINDTYQVSRRLTLTLGLRWELPGMYSEKKNRLTELLPNAPDPLSQETGLSLEGNWRWLTRQHTRHGKYDRPLYRA